jgi:hypothetical protein
MFGYRPANGEDVPMTTQESQELFAFYVLRHRCPPLVVLRSLSSSADAMPAGLGQFVAELLPEERSAPRTYGRAARLIESEMISPWAS